MAGLAGIAALGGGAVGAAVVGAVVLGVGPADAPGLDRTPPLTSISRTPVTPVHSRSDSPGPAHRYASRAAAPRSMPTVPYVGSDTIPVALRARISHNAPR